MTALERLHQQLMNATNKHKYLRELKAKKAKFGFEGHFHSEELILRAAEAIKAARWMDPDVKIEAGVNYGSGTLKIYTNNELLAEELRKIEHVY